MANTTLEKKPSQEQRILQRLQEANGEWVSAREFVQGMYISQTSARITQLRAKGWDIETSEHRDGGYGFCRYRLKPKGTLF